MEEYRIAGAIIVAAGDSRRMEGGDKMFALLGGQAILARVIDAFQTCKLIDRIVVVVNKSSMEKSRRLVTEHGWTKVAEVCPGGERRQDSVRVGLDRLGHCHWVVIHDGARPLVTEYLIRRGMMAAEETGAAVAAVPVTDTIKVAGNDKIVQQTLSRNRLWSVQTPQIFSFEMITEAYGKVKAEITDDASLVELLGNKVKLYMGAYDNIKITTPVDLVLGEVLWQKYGK
ncbi:2-C-methyl-D-erythritol 4-phosphate cytidylyltransferase [Chloroflexota bacterium]